MKVCLIARYAVLGYFFTVGVSADVFAKDLKENPTTLESVIILSRHGVRSPLDSKAHLDELTSNSWRQWSVKPGYLTPRGYRLVQEMGNYYKDYLVSEKLLTGEAEKDKENIYFHANNPSRTIQTALALGESLLGTSVTVNSAPEGKTDPLFVGLGKLDNATKDAAMQGQYGDNPQAIVTAYRSQFDLLEKAMGRKGQFAGPDANLRTAAKIIDTIIMEYAEGVPDIAWGRIGKEDLTELCKLAAVDFILLARTPYMSTERMSNLVGQIGSTLEEDAGGKSVYKTFSNKKLNVMVAHDTTISNVANLLNLNWIIPGFIQNMPTLGGALVFELRKGADGSDVAGQYFVRTYYVSQTMDQLRNGDELSLENPPAKSSIFVPGASTAVKGYDAPLADFLAVVKKATNPELIEKK